MAGKTNIAALIKGMSPRVNSVDYVFTSLKEPNKIDRAEIICKFKEKEDTTIVIEQKKTDKLNLSHDYVASWITLMVHTSLDAVGLTAIFLTELAKKDMSCNVIAGYFHDHILVAKKDSEKAMRVLKLLSEKYI